MFFRRSRKTKNPKRFTEDEDVLLAQCVGNADKIDWNEIASHFKDRSARQVRERWNLYLSPDINVQPWTDEEDNLLIEKINEFGCRWSKLNTFFSGRTQMAIKNRWNSHIKRIVQRKTNGMYELREFYNKESQQIRTSKQIQRHKTAVKVLMKTLKTHKKPTPGFISDESEENTEEKAEETLTKQCTLDHDLPEYDQQLIKFTPDSIFLDGSSDFPFDVSKDDNCVLD